MNKEIINFYYKRIVKFLITLVLLMISLLVFKVEVTWLDLFETILTKCVELFLLITLFLSVKFYGTEVITLKQYAIGVSMVALVLSLFFWLALNLDYLEQFSINLELISWLFILIFLVYIISDDLKRSIST